MDLATAIISALAIVVSSALGLWARARFATKNDIKELKEDGPFLTKRDIYKNGGRTYFVYREDCLRAHNEITIELKAITSKLNNLDQCLTRVSERLAQVSEQLKGLKNEHH